MEFVDERAEDLVARLAGGDARVCFTCSFQAEDMVVLHMLLRHRAEAPVLFLDTGYHFPEVYEYRDRMAREWKLNLVNLEASLSRQEQESLHGELYRSAPDRCCHIRKVEPLLAGLAGFEVWFTGLRREQSPTRAGLRQVETQTLPTGERVTKVSPLAAWTSREVWSYLRSNGIEPLPLYAQGFASIGCQPCTALPADLDHPRSGRWGGAKLECGIHTFGKPA